ncbi:MAG: PA14 domain-containing protein [Caldilineaceae bacterium]|nr:PA14 domain-containing protein [Caldilineaceae bacterium]
MSTAISRSAQITRKRWQTAAAALFLLGLLLGPQPVAAAPLQQPVIPYVHIIRPGETLAGIASLYGVTVQELRAANHLSNRAAVTSCTPNNDSTQARGTVQLNGQPVAGYGVVFSWQPDGNVVARTSTGGGGEFDFILHGAGPRAGNWWFWVENGAGNRISEMAHVHTDRDPHTGKCQRAVISFDIGNPELTYIGRRLQIPLGGSPAAGTARAAAYNTYHVIGSGQTLAAIAELYGVPVEQLKAANGLNNRATVVGCEPNADSTQARGTVRLNGKPVNGYRVAFSWQPDGKVVGRRASGEGAAAGAYTHILQASGPREGNWWFWVENKDGKRISEMAHVRTDRLPHAGMCQRPVIDFDIRDPGLTYVGRRLHITVGGEVTAAWTGAFYGNRELRGDPLLSRQDASLRFDWQGGRPGPAVSGDNFSAAWTTTRRFQAGAYRFFARADDGVRLYVDGVLVVADWNIHPATRSFGDIYLSPGNHTVRVEYFEAEGLASISVWWEKI